VDKRVNLCHQESMHRCLGVTEVQQMKCMYFTRHPNEEGCRSSLLDGSHWVCIDKNAIENETKEVTDDE
jgi:hypothetical protein